MKRYYIICIIFFCCSSCKMIAKLGHGAKKPKTENEHSILRWVEKKGFTEAKVVSASPDAFEFFAPAFLTSIFIFDNTGRFHAIGYHQGRFCLPDVDKLIMKLQPSIKLLNFPDSFIIIQQYRTEKLIDFQNKTTDQKDSLIKHFFKTLDVRDLKKNAKLISDTFYLDYNSMSKKLRTLKGEPISNHPTTTTNYSIFIPFALYEGNKVQVKEIRKYYNAALQASYSRFTIILLNLDKQKWWGEDWNEKLQISQN